MNSKSPTYQNQLRITQKKQEQCRSRTYDGEKTASSTNGVGKIGHLLIKD
jgi:hypothetical protein